MFTLVHNSVLSSINFNKELKICNICIGIDELDKTHFPNILRFHSKKCILGLNLSWFVDDINSLTLSNFFNLIYQQHKTNPNDLSNNYLHKIKGGGKILLYWTLNELLKNKLIKKNQMITLEIEEGIEDEDKDKLIKYYKSLSFIFNDDYTMESTVENVILSIDININKEMINFYSFLESNSIQIN
jgi:hypothetical protein